MLKCTCEECGKEFLALPSAIKKGNGRFCSRVCQGRWQSKYRRGENSANWRGGKVTWICEQCGKEFFVYPNQIKMTKFCSPKCKGKWMSKHRIGKKAAGWQGGKIKLICEICGKEFEVYPSDEKRGERKFCSNECRGQWLSKYIRGKNHPRWKGGRSPYCSKWNEPFREYIRDKFGRICFLCGKTEKENGKRLSVHHVNGNKDCGCDGDVACQFVPLCASCHGKVHSKKVDWEKKIKDKMRTKLNGWYI